MNNLLEQWNEHIVRGNQLSRELEDIEDIIEKSKGADICFSSGTSGAVFIRVLSPDKMQELRENVVVAIMRIRDEKTVELEKLMGVRKPAIINPVFEAAVQGMIESARVEHEGPDDIIDVPFPDSDPVEEKLAELLVSEEKIIGEAKPKYPEMTVDLVKSMYLDEGKTQGDIAKYFGVKKTDVNTFLQKYKLFRTSKKEDGFLDSKVQARQSKK